MQKVSPWLTLPAQLTRVLYIAHPRILSGRNPAPTHHGPLQWATQIAFARDMQPKGYAPCVVCGPHQGRCTARHHGPRLKATGPPRMMQKTAGLDPAITANLFLEVPSHATSHLERPISCGKFIFPSHYLPLPILDVPSAVVNSSSHLITCHFPSWKSHVMW